MTTVKEKLSVRCVAIFMNIYWILNKMNYKLYSRVPFLSPLSFVLFPLCLAIGKRKHTGVISVSTRDYNFNLVL